MQASIIQTRCFACKFTHSIISLCVQHPNSLCATRAMWQKWVQYPKYDNLATCTIWLRLFRLVEACSRSGFKISWNASRFQSSLVHIRPAKRSKIVSTGKFWPQTIGTTLCSRFFSPPKTRSHYFRREKVLGSDHPDTCASRRFYNVLKQWDAGWST